MTQQLQLTSPVKLDLTLFQQLFPKADSKILIKHMPHLIDVLHSFNIGPPLRLAAFVAQTGHETGSLRFMSEIWGPTPQQKKYDPPHDLAKRLGNEKIGDGLLYKGRGAIQLTGKDNYRDCGNDIGVNLVANPETAAQPHLAFKVAGWFWRKHKLNNLADACNFDGITRKINGGLNGKADRDERYVNALRVLKITSKGVA